MVIAALVTFLGGVFPGLSLRPFCLENCLLKHRGAKLWMLWELSVLTFQVLQRSWECCDIHSQGYSCLGNVGF